MRQETQRVLIGETINGEKPSTSFKIVSPQDVKPKTVRCTPNIAAAFCLLSSQSISFSKSVPHLREQVSNSQVTNRETHPLYLY